MYRKLENQNKDRQEYWHIPFNLSRHSYYSYLETPEGKHFFFNICHIKLKLQMMIKYDNHLKKILSFFWGGGSFPGFTVAMATATKNGIFTTFLNA